MKAAPDPLETIRTRWIDLPEAPFVARVVDGKALLVSRTGQYFDDIMTGCVVELEGRAHVIGQLLGQHIFHGVYGPKSPIKDLLRMHNALPHDTKPCDPDAYMAIVRVSLTIKQVWTAEETPWPK